MQYYSFILCCPWATLSSPPEDLELQDCASKKGFQMFQQQKRPHFSQKKSKLKAYFVSNWHTLKNRWPTTQTTLFTQIRLLDVLKFQFKWQQVVIWGVIPNLQEYTRIGAIHHCLSGNVEIQKAQKLAGLLTLVVEWLQPIV